MIGAHFDYWCNKTFEVIGAHFGGLENIAVETINFINVSEAKIQVMENLCGFIPATIEIFMKEEETFF